MVNNQLEKTARDLAFASLDEQKEIRLEIEEEGERQGLHFDSLAPIYQGMARGSYIGFTVPAVNLRGLVFDTARAVFQAARAIHAGPFVFEIAPSELAAGRQSFDEYAGEVLVAALAEGWHGPLFLQGDHFALEDSGADAFTRLIETASLAVRAGFYQIDIDASDLVNAAGATAEQRQQVNAQATARAIHMLQHLEPVKKSILIGGEVGQIGGELTSETEMHAFLSLVRGQFGPGETGIGKVSVNTGTQHGGLVNAAGKLERMNVDFELTKRLSAMARRDFGLPGVVQHGASTLSLDQLARLPGCGVNEVHLATGIQNLVFDHPTFPKPLLERMKRELTGVVQNRTTPENGALEPGEQSAIFYHQRWQSWGIYKKELWGLPEPVKTALRVSLREWFQQVFEALKLGGTDWITGEMASRIGHDGEH